MFYFRSIGTCGPKIESMIKEGAARASTVSTVKTHKEYEAVRFLDEWGWEGCVAPARPGERAQAEGGAAICARR